MIEIRRQRIVLEAFFTFEIYRSAAGGLPVSLPGPPRQPGEQGGKDALDALIAFGTGRLF